MPDVAVVVNVTVVASALKTSDDAKVMLRADLENERDTIAQYRRRVVRCESLGEFVTSEHIREILREEQDHLSELASALGIDPPDAGMAA